MKCVFSWMGVNVNLNLVTKNSEKLFLRASRFVSTKFKFILK